VDWRDRAQSFESMALIEPYSFDLAARDGPPQALRSWGVTEGFFEAIGARPILGRTFTLEEHAPNAPLAVVISYSLWQQRFGADPGLAGRAIQLDGQPATVVGVAPPWLRYPDARDMWSPKRWHYDGERTDRRSSYMYAVGRLRPGVTVAQGQAELDAIGAQMASRSMSSCWVTFVPRYSCSWSPWVSSC